jgi:hypothetical protein
MQENETVLSEYKFTGLSGDTYHPRVQNGQWALILPCSFYDIVYWCNIPDDEALILKLKYGG